MNNSKPPGETATTFLSGDFELELPSEVRRKAQEFADADGISLEEFVTIAIAEKIAFIEHCAEAVQESPSNSIRKCRKLSSIGQ